MVQSSLCDCVSRFSLPSGALGRAPSFWLLGCSSAAVDILTHASAHLRVASVRHARPAVESAAVPDLVVSVPGPGPRWPSTSRFVVPTPPTLRYTWPFPPFWLFRWTLIGPLTTWCVTVTGVSRLGLFTGGRRSWETSGHFLEGHTTAALSSPALVCCAHTCWDRLLTAVLDVLVVSLPLHIWVSDTQHSRGVLGTRRPVVSVSRRQVWRERCSGRAACGGSW